MSKRIPLRLLGLLAILSLAAAPLGCTSEDPGANDNPAVNEKVKVQLLDYDGLQKLIKSHLGKVVVVDVWSTT